jgi:predicted RNase H-like HicB family nuclease
MYAIEIFYTEEDEGFIAVVPELSGCSAFGETEERALKRSRLPCSSGWRQQKR